MSNLFCICYKYSLFTSFFSFFCYWILWYIFFLLLKRFFYKIIFLSFCNFFTHTQIYTYKKFSSLSFFFFCNAFYWIFQCTEHTQSISFFSSFVFIIIITFCNCYLIQMCIFFNNPFGCQQCIILDLQKIIRLFLAHTNYEKYKVYVAATVSVRATFPSDIFRWSSNRVAFSVLFIVTKLGSIFIRNANSELSPLNLRFFNIQRKILWVITIKAETKDEHVFFTETNLSVIFY